MNIAVDNTTATIKSVVTVDFNGSIDFNIGEDGMIVDGDKTITYQELYDMVRPVEEVEETEASEINYYSEPTA